MELTREQVLATLGRLLPELAHLGVADLALFGSFARNEHGPDSDVDVLVEFARPPSFREWLDVRDCLAAALGRPVDLVMTTAVKPRLRKAIFAEAVHVA